MAGELRLGGGPVGSQPANHQIRFRHRIRPMKPDLIYLPICSWPSHDCYRISIHATLARCSEATGHPSRLRFGAMCRPRLVGRATEWREHRRQTRERALSPAKRCSDSSLARSDLDQWLDIRAYSLLFLTPPVPVNPEQTQATFDCFLPRTYHPWRELLLHRSTCFHCAVVCTSL